MKNKILNSIREQILKYGFKKFTIDDVCIDLMISKKTIYKYFDSKEQMISEIIDAHIETDRTNTLKTLGEKAGLFEKLNSVIMCYYDYKIPLKLVDELKTFFPQQWSKVEELFLFKQELFRNIMNEGIEQGCISSEVDIDVVMLTIQKTIPAIFDYEFLLSHDRNRETANHMLDEFCKLIFHGISK